MNFIKNPNLPERPVKSLVVSGIHTNFSSYLKNMGIQIIESEDIKGIDNFVKYHTDMQIIHLGDNKFLLEKSCIKLQNEIKSLGGNVILSKKEVKNTYPNDILLNALVIDKYIVGNIKYLDSNLINLEKQGYKIINVKQGYCKCSTAIVSKNAIITSDKTIARALGGFIDVLLIKNGEINIIDYDYGFIGGSCGLISKDLLLFFGDVTKHSDYNKIKYFALNNGVYIDYIGNTMLEDIGGIVQIAE